MMDTPSYDVFKGTPEKKPLWLGAVPGLERAKEQMNRMASRLPGDYFIFDPVTDNVVASVDTRSLGHEE
jgi:hypothetical protein